MSLTPNEIEKGPRSVAYWEAYYKQNPHPFNPSAFAMEVARQLDEPGLLIELGCGNGRDAVFLSRSINCSVLAIDQCAEEMERLNQAHTHDRLRFEAADFSVFESHEAPLYVYSRWTMHAIDEEAEERTLDWVARALRPGGRFFVEARSIQDDLYGKGQPMGGHAFFTDHYRRFMDKDAFIRKLEQRGLHILRSEESRGFAVYKDDDPVIVRVVAGKP